MEISNSIFNTLKEICSYFKDKKIDFCLAGGLAVSVLSKPRATEDIDLIVIIDKEKKNLIQEILSSNFHVLDDHDENIKIGSFNLWRIVLKDKLSENGFLILDVIYADTDFLKRAVKNSNVFNYNDIEIPIIKPEDLILIKMNSKRPQDKIDVENIFSELKDKLDLEYIEKNKNKIK